MTRIVLLAFLLAFAVAPIAGQKRGAVLARRMEQFSAAVEQGPIDSVLPFFPRRGSWTWAQTAHYPGRADHLRVRRFTSAETRTVIDDGGVACESFLRTAGFGISGVLMIDLGSEPWRRARGTRFVPPGAAASSEVFVEWRLEDGRWVVSSYGDATYETPRLLGVPVSTVRRDPVQQPLRLPLRADGHYAGGQPWYADNEPLRFEGRLYVKYADPAVFQAGEITRIASWGRVGVYAETGVSRNFGTLYVPVNARGEFQRYWNEHDGPPPTCR